MLNVQKIERTLSSYVKSGYDKSCLKRTMNKTEPCINQTLNMVSMWSIFINLTCIYRTPVYS